jgi:hypothetical protein
MTSDELSKAIKSLRPTAQFSFIESDYSTITWDVLDGEAPSYKELEAALEKIKADEAKEITVKSTARESLLEKLGITEDEAKLLLS